MTAPLFDPISPTILSMNEWMLAFSNFMVVSVPDTKHMFRSADIYAIVHKRRNGHRMFSKLVLADELEFFLGLEDIHDTKHVHTIDFISNQNGRRIKSFVKVMIPLKQEIVPKLAAIKTNSFVANGLATSERSSIYSQMTSGISWSFIPTRRA